MGVKIIKHTSTKISLQIDLELDDNSMLASENRIQKALNEAGLKVTQLALTQFDTDGRPIDVSGKKLTSKGAQKKSTKVRTGK